MLQADPLEHLECAAPLLRRGHAKHFEHECDVLEDGARGNQLEVLEDEPDAAPIFLDVAARQFREVVVVDVDLALARFFLDEKKTQQRRLACAARTGEEHELTLVDRERQILQRVQTAAVKFREVVRLDHAACAPGAKGLTCSVG